MSKVSISQLKNLVKIISKQKLPVLIRGPHGIGKSSVVYQIAQELNLPVVERRASQMPDAGDFVGMPFTTGTDKKITNFAPPDFFHKVCNEPCIFFLDEVDRCQADVAQAIFELGDSRKIYGHKLHEGTLVFLACNGSPYTQGKYNVRDFDPAELNRYMVFDLEVSADEWVAWAKENKILPEVVSYIRQHPNNLIYSGDFKPNQVYPTPRSWERFSATLNDVEKHERDPFTVYQLAGTTLGQETASAFRTFFEEFGRQAVPEDIINGNIGKLADLSHTQHLDLVERCKTHPVFQKELTDENLRFIGLYMSNHLPPEIAKTFLSYVTNSFTGNMIRFPYIEVNGQKMDGYFRMLYGSKEKTEEEK